MKKLIRKILREQEEEMISAPSFTFFLNNWEDVLDWANGRLFRMNGDIDLSHSDIETLGGLVELDGDLKLIRCQNLQSLGKLRNVSGFLDLENCENLQSLGELRSVGSVLNLIRSYNLTSLGELRSVGGYLDLSFSAIAKTMTDEEIRNQIDIKGRIFR